MGKFYPQAVAMQGTTAVFHGKSGETRQIAVETRLVFLIIDTLF
jgi:hypothetical protein